MSVIKQMDDRLANMIAAGEVVERPSSVIKELVENSIDAKSTEINISVIDNGLQEIKVSDNGIGMTKQDAKKAFLRHATSKIKTEYDLSRINTLGFRGEALAAILSVSRITLKTRMENTDAYYVKYEDSKLIEEGVTSLNRGTEIIVNDLFYNTPARYKYLKSEYSERAAIIDIFDRLALAHPNIRFSLTMDEKLVKQTFGNNDYYSLIQQIYGSNILKDLTYFENEFQKIKVYGYLVTPHISRSRRKDISIFVNGRYIKNYGVTQAIIDGYNTFLMTNRYPIAIIHLEMDPVLLDVNVHPQKFEVKFVNETLIKYHIELFIKEALTNKNHEIPKNLEITSPTFKETYIKEELDFEYTENNLDVIETFTDINEEKVPEGKLQKEYSEYQQTKKLPNFSYVGTLAATYLLFQNEEGMYMIDQHAAEERIRYEHYYNIMSNPEIVSKQMLISRPLTLSSGDLDFVKNYIEEFNKLGFKFNSSMHLTSHPTFIKDKDLDTAIDSMITMLEERGNIDLGKLIDNLAKDKSCKASIKANDPLSKIEIDNLIVNLRKTKNPYTCPHGRPVLIKLTYYEIERMFKRVVI